MRKTFKHSVGFYYQDAAQNEVVAWHNCARKPIRMTDEDYGLIKAGHNINCPKCRKPVTMWQPMQERNNDTEENGSYLRRCSRICKNLERRKGPSRRELI